MDRGVPEFVPNVDEVKAVEWVSIDEIDDFLG